MLYGMINTAHKTKDVRLDDGSYCVDLLDASEYAIERYITAIYQTSYNYKEYEGGQA